ncbi:HesB-like protein [Clostridium sardiniense]|uniref:HesB-like protein n=1 Tax=Clostridium sardiniense TaxID=29369 RepID=A0ABS7KTR2_CLOSR|nr:HesB-like protein [Clostridium sardiniense]MBM7833111.1 HesB-like selenoprotein [Clostridium sardiniense]MBY0753978.1 HesB-like protein [Clostridium sardiniense]MDQ0459506.1 HesB-like selenoprotein [Clostridium sardiniense]
MKNMTISEDAYKEFKEFLDENKVENYNIRINLGGMACSGPVFNITVDEATDDDVVEVVNDINFVIEKRLIEEFGGFILLSAEENNGNGLSLKPVIAPEGGCGSCGGGCH